LYRQPDENASKIAKFAVADIAGTYEAEVYRRDIIADVDPDTFRCILIVPASQEISHFQGETG